VKEKIMRAFAEKLLHDESGATAIEYGMLAALISVTIIGVVTMVGTKLSGVFNRIATVLATVHDH
jgi:pilus assembly protein Flp/PilA